MPTDIGSINSNLANYSHAHVTESLWGSDESQPKLSPLFGRSVEVVPPKAVSQNTFRNLQTADTVSKTLNALVSIGNQKPEVARSYGINFIRANAVRQAADAEGYVDAARPLRSGYCGGRCGEMTHLTIAVLNALRTTTTPNPFVIAEASIPSVNDSHVFALIGDPREVSASEVVVADGWLNKTSAHTLDRNRLSSDLAIRSAVASDFATRDLDFMSRHIQRLTDDEAASAFTNNRQTSAKGLRERFIAVTGMQRGVSGTEPQGRINTIAPFDVDTFKSAPVVEHYRDGGYGTIKSFDYTHESLVELMQESRDFLNTTKFV